MTSRFCRISHDPWFSCQGININILYKSMILLIPYHDFMPADDFQIEILQSHNI